MNWFASSVQVAETTCLYLTPLLYMRLYSFVYLFVYRLTEAYNGCKDKVWYLTSIQTQMDLIQSAVSVSILTNELVPSLSAIIKQMDGLSRLYAKTGYIAVVLKKVIILHYVYHVLYMHLRTMYKTQYRNIKFP